MDNRYRSSNDAKRKSNKDIAYDSELKRLFKIVINPIEGAGEHPKKDDQGHFRSRALIDSL